MASPTQANLLSLVESLNANQIRGELAKMDRQRKALIHLLRAAVTREQAEARRLRRVGGAKGGAHG
jgi:hypothetical protein